MTFFFRVLTDIKSGSIAQEFINSKPNTIWRQIYEKQMNDESFMPISEATKNILQKDQLLTQYSEIESMMYNTKPCLLKTLWKSPSKDRHSMAFQKGCRTFQPQIREQMCLDTAISMLLMKPVFFYEQKNILVKTLKVS